MESFRFRTPSPTAVFLETLLSWLSRSFSSSERRVTLHGWRRRFLERGADACGVDNVDGSQRRLPGRPPDVDRRWTTVAGHERLGYRRPIDQRRPDTVLDHSTLWHLYTSAAAVAIFRCLPQQCCMTSVTFLLMLAPLSANPVHLHQLYHDSNFGCSYQAEFHFSHYILIRITMLHNTKKLSVPETLTIPKVIIKLTHY